MRNNEINATILNQSLEGLCGQTCIALLLGKTVQEIVSETNYGKNKVTGKRLFEALDYYKIPHAEKMKYTRGKAVDLPQCCILSEHGHFLLHYDGAFYDNIKGAYQEYDYSALVAYLEVCL